MKVVTEAIKLATPKPLAVIDITPEVKDKVVAAGIKEGIVTVFSPHATAAVKINEKEPKLQEDVIEWLQGLAPAHRDYGHNIDPVDGRSNAHSHLLGLFMESSVQIPLKNGELLLGRWQTIFFVELDGPREERQVVISIMGV